MGSWHKNTVLMKLNTPTVYDPGQRCRVPVLRLLRHKFPVNKLYHIEHFTLLKSTKTQS